MFMYLLNEGMRNTALVVERLLFKSAFNPQMSSVLGKVRRSIQFLADRDKLPHSFSHQKWKEKQQLLLILILPAFGQ